MAQPIETLTSVQEAAVRAAIGLTAPPPAEALAADILYHDNFTGDPQTMAHNATRLVLPGPGTSKAYATLGNPLVRYENGECILANIAPTGAKTVVLYESTSRTITAGLTAIFEITPCFKPGAGTRQTMLGFSGLVTSAGPHGGMVQFVQLAGETSCTVRTSRMSSNADTTFNTICGAGIITKEGQRVRVAVRHQSLTKQQFWMQGANLESFGAVLGSDVWVLLAETAADMSAAAVVYPAVVQQYEGVTKIHSMQVLQNWEPSVRCRSFDHQWDNIGTHIPTLGRDPVSGLAVMAWNFGEDHTSQDKMFRASVKLSDGSWTDPVTIQAAGADEDFQTIGSLSVMDGSLWLIYTAQLTEGVGGTLKKRSVAIDAETGEITLGAITVLGVPGTDNLTFNPVVQTASGRLIIPVHTSTAIDQFVSYSDDDGATWSALVTVSTTGTWRGEGVLINEPDGGVGCYLRTNLDSAYYSRSTDDGETWSAEKAVTAIPQMSSTSGSRISGINLANGECWLIGNDSRTERRELTLWRVGNDAEILDKIYLGDFNTHRETLGTLKLQYPVILEDGEDLLIGVSRQDSGLNAGSAILFFARRKGPALPVEMGGTSLLQRKNTVSGRRVKNGLDLVYSTTPTPDMSLGNLFYITLTASTATFGAPLNPLPWEELTIVVAQGGVGSFTIAGWNAIYQFNGLTATLQTAVGASNVFRFVFNPLVNKCVIASFI